MRVWKCCRCLMKGEAKLDKKLFVEMNAEDNRMVAIDVAG